MFEERLRIVFILFSACWLVVTLRLFQLQVVQADHYQQLAEDRLVRGTRILAPIRGRLLDRKDRVLASDEPSWGIALHYGLLANDPAFFAQLADRIRGDRSFLRLQARRIEERLGTDEGLSADELAVAYAARIDADWVRAQYAELIDLLAARFAGVTPQELTAEVQEHIDRIQRWKEAYVAQHRLPGHEADQPLIREETGCVPVVGGLNHEQHIDAQLLFMDRYPWLLQTGAAELRDSRRRLYHDADAMAQVLGHLREVSAADIAEYPYQQGGRVVHRDGYEGRDWIGARGAELMCESQLRGQRGFLRVFYDDRPPERLDPEHGGDVRLSLDHDLQRAIFAELERTVTAVSDDHARQAGFSTPISPAGGGSVVVLDVATREVLALVSYPSYDPNHYYDLVTSLASDVRRYPLHFRAVYSAYEPGSIVKPITVAAAHGAGLIDEHTLLECQGKLFPDDPRPAFRCWRPQGSDQPMHHGQITSEQAIKGSCNVFCYQLGRLFCERSGSSQMGVQRMCEWLDLFGVGRHTGTGLQEERQGILPTPHYLATVKNRAVNPADARFYAIGQAELQVTPIQAANIAAIYASGENRALTIVHDDPRQRPVARLPVAPGVWQIVRRGMFAVVNEPGGTARHYAHLEDPNYVLCGKSGSAETRRWVTDYRVQYRLHEELHSVVVQADNQATAAREFRRVVTEPEATVVDYTPVGFWPPHEQVDGRKFSHAWFIAFIQPRRSDGGPDWSATARVAIAALVEFGGSGGATSGTLCKQVARLIIDQFPELVAERTVRISQGPQ